MTLSDLPEELLLLLLSYLDVSDLLQLSRTCYLLRQLATDPILHNARLLYARDDLARRLLQRKTRAQLSPPIAWIWLSRVNVQSRAISRSLVKIRLSHRLDSRPSLQDLVQRSIVPRYAISISPLLLQSQRAVYKNHLKNGLCRKLQRRPSMNSLASLNIIPEECAKRTISPALIETRRRVIKESLKDGLRGWIENRGLKAQQRRALELDESERSTVKMLVRRLTARKLAQELERKADLASMEKKRAQARWGRAHELQKLKEERQGFSQRHPTKVHVSQLRRFWEGVVRPTAI